MQKTWKELLGTDTTDVVVDGNFLSRRMGPNQYRIVWSFKSRKQASEVLKTWIKEVQEAA